MPDIAHDWMRWLERLPFVVGRMVSTEYTEHSFPAAYLLLILTLRPQPDVRGPQRPSVGYQNPLREGKNSIAADFLVACVDAFDRSELGLSSSSQSYNRIHNTQAMAATCLVGIGLPPFSENASHGKPG